MRKTKRNYENRTESRPKKKYTQKPRPKNKKGFWEGIKKKEEFSKFKTFKSGESKRTFKDKAEDMKEVRENTGQFEKKASKNRRDGLVRIPKSVERKSRAKNSRSKFGRESDPNFKHKNKRDNKRIDSKKTSRRGKYKKEEKSETKEYTMKFPGERSTRPRKTHKVICDACGVKCEVTFKPKGIKPVLCNKCFKKVNN